VSSKPASLGLRAGQSPDQAANSAAIELKPERAELRTALLQMLMVFGAGVTVLWAGLLFWALARLVGAI
jgi:hypothetical protein